MIKLIREDINSNDLNIIDIYVDTDAPNDPDGVFVIGTCNIDAKSQNIAKEFVKQHSEMADVSDSAFEPFMASPDNFNVSITIDGFPLNKQGDEPNPYLRIDLFYNDNLNNGFYLPLGWVDFNGWKDILSNKNSYDIIIDKNELCNSIKELANKVFATGEEQSVENNKIVSAVLDKNGNKLKSPEEEKAEKLQNYISQKYADITEIWNDAIDTRGDAVEYRHYDEARKWDEVIDRAAELKAEILDYAEENNIKINKANPSFRCGHDSNKYLDTFEFNPNNI